jgi:hypothetical protein
LEYSEKFSGEQGVSCNQSSDETVTTKHKE